MRNFNDSLIVPKNLEKGTLWDFLTFVLLQDIKQKEGWTLCRHQKFLKKKTKNEKGVSKKLSKKNKNENFEQSHSAENSEKKGDPLGFFNILSVAKYQKIERTLWGHSKNFEKKVSQSRKVS